MLINQPFCPTWRPWLGMALRSERRPARLGWNGFGIESLPLLEPETDPRRILFANLKIFSRQTCNH